MSERSGKVTQVQIERAIRAATAEGLRIVRIVARVDGYVIETASLNSGSEPFNNKPKLVL